ncbi:aminotransferase class IV [Nibricoccus sp. IMCC34717]|uniref:aminotransferase class IV n=1 Tax=Nibricoccus sp. IMCC34717 TaxID=3034021 RepID=UPI00384CB9CA
MNTPQGLLDGEWLPADAPIASAASEAFQFGIGIFTTIGVRAGRATWLTAHAERLARDAVRLGLSDAVPEGWSSRVQNVVEANGMREGAIKSMRFLDRGRVREWITPRSFTLSSGPTLHARLQVARCLPRTRRALANAKSLNYGEHWLATQAARTAGFTDALWIDADGRVLECATAAFFLVRAGDLVTPPLADGVLDGVARRRLLALVPAVREATITERDLDTCDEVFAANAVAGVIPIQAIGSRVWAAPGPITAGLIERVLEDFVRV